MKNSLFAMVQSVVFDLQTTSNQLTPVVWWEDEYFSEFYPLFRRSFMKDGERVTVLVVQTEYSPSCTLSNPILVLITFHFQEQ